MIAVVSANDVPQLRPPRQERSREALRKILNAAEEVLVKDGLDHFTIASVAQEAGVSVGGVYRRFTGKDQLIDAVVALQMSQVEETVANALQNAEPGLAAVITAFAEAAAQNFPRVGRVAIALAGSQQTPALQLRGINSAVALQRLFMDAAAPHMGEIVRPEPATALGTAFRTILGSGVHRAAMAQWWPDGLTWGQWADEIAAMTTGYLVGRYPHGAS